MRTATAALLLAAALAAQRPPTDPASVEAGRQLYMGSCSGCHGATGEGSQGPSLLSGRASRLANQALFSAIKNGLPGTSMPNFPLPDDKVWQIAAFVRSLTAPAASVHTTGDPERGRGLFFGSANCSRCHMILGEGGYPGPDLSQIGATRTLPQLRESLIKPSARIAAGFEPVTARRKDGSVLQGVAKNYNNYTAQIVDQTGRLHILDRSGLSSFEVSLQSPMPPVAPSDLPDLLAFLARQSTRIQSGAAR